MKKTFIIPTLLALSASTLLSSASPKIYAEEPPVLQDQPQEAAINSNEFEIQADASQKSFTIRITNISVDTDTIYIPVWSQQNNQDDIRWYTADKVSDTFWQCTVDIANHNNDSGTYEVHAYALLQDGTLSFLNSTQFHVDAVGHGALSCTTAHADNGQYRLELTGASSPAGIQQVQIPVWSQSNGQDDIVWYDAIHSGNSWYIDVDIRNHAYASGDYVAHAYVTDNRGIRQIAADTHFEVAQMQTNKISTMIDSNDSHVTVTLRNASLPEGTNTISIPVWGSSGGQNDIHWYPAQQIDAFTYQAVVPLSNHCETGIYNVHAYAVGEGKAMLVGADTFNIKAMTPTVTLSDRDDANGYFTLSIAGIQFPDTIQSIVVPIWSQKDGQDDIIWYPAQRNGNQWTVTVDITDHKMDTGIYYAHVYSVDNHGALSLIANTYVDVIMPSLQPFIDCEVLPDLSNVRLTVHNLPGTAMVRVPVWGDENGQNDIQWYEAEKLDNRTWVVNVPLRNHLELGSYQAHVYSLTNNSLQLITAGTFQIDELSNNIFMGTEGLTSLKNQIQGIIDSRNGIWSVYVKNLNTNEYLLINDQAMSAASVLKLFIMEYAYSQIEKGQFSKTILNQSLLNAMITSSSNDASNELVTRLSGCNDNHTGTIMLNEHMQTEGYTSSYLSGTFNPSSAAYAYYGGKTSTSAKDCGRLLESIYRGECVSGQASSEMLNMLLNQQRRSKIPAVLPAGVACANKTGEHDTAQNDVAIVYSPNCDYVICVFNNFFVSEYEAIYGIRAISSTVYDYFN